MARLECENMWHYAGSRESSFTPNLDRLSCLYRGFAGKTPFGPAATAAAASASQKEGICAGVTGGSRAGVRSPPNPPYLSPAALALSALGFVVERVDPLGAGRAGESRRLRVEAA